MPKKTLDLVNSLDIYHVSLKTLFDSLLKGSSRLSGRMVYDTLTFTLTQTEADVDSIYFECVFRNDEHKSELTKCYCEDPDKLRELKPHLEKIISNPEGLSGLRITNNAHYLETAERIAKQAYLCTAGDDYRPGYFSEIKLDDVGVTLHQINHMNARSLAHKKNYSLRNLEFFIPFDQHKPDKLRYQEESIGVMRVLFSDRSSTNNKTCGDKIRLQIDTERAGFASLQS